MLLATDNTTVTAYINKQGGESLLDLVQPSCRSSSAVYTEQGPYESHIPTGKTQHLGGPVVEERGNSSNRVVSQSGSGFSDFHT